MVFIKALVKFGPGELGLELKNVQEPSPKDKEIKVKVIAAGICGTDIHIMLDEYPYNAPVILGHEFVGSVVELGQKVSSFCVGDIVISLTAVKTCHQCRYCRDGLIMLCEERFSIGSGVNGAFAEYLTIPSNLAFVVPKEVSHLESIAISEPLACVTRGVIERSPVKAGDFVLVSGPGTIGLLTLQLSKLCGAYVIVVGTPEDQERLRFAEMLGADMIISDPKYVLSKIKNLTEYGVDIAFECAGSEKSADTCLQALRKQGHYTQIGLFGKDINLNMDLLVYNEISVTTSFASEPSSWEIALRLLKNDQIKLEPLVSNKFPLEKWKDAFKMVMNGEGYKVLLIP